MGSAALKKTKTPALLMFRESSGQARVIVILFSSMKRKLALRLQCVGCGCLYEALDSKRLYCDERCRERCKRLARRTLFPTPLASAIAFTRAEILFREDLYRTCPASAVGYRLKCRELSLWFPIEGETKRYDGRMRSERFFWLDPFEAPLVPLDSFYELEWVSEGGHPIEVQAEYPVRVSFFRMTTPGGSASNRALHRRLKTWMDDGAVLLDRAGRPRTLPTTTARPMKPPASQLQSAVPLNDLLPSPETDFSMRVLQTSEPEPTRSQNRLPMPTDSTQRRAPTTLALPTPEPVQGGALATPVQTAYDVDKVRAPKETALPVQAAVHGRSPNTPASLTQEAGPGRSPRRAGGNRLRNP